MYAVHVVAISAETNYFTFDDLRLGHSSQQVIGRFLCFWDAQNIKKDCDFMDIILLLLDEKRTVIHGFIPVARAGQFCNVLQEKVIFGLGGFEVGRCTNLYKITDHPTTIVEKTHVEATIEREKYMLRKVDHLQALANTNLELPYPI